MKNLKFGILAFGVLGALSLFIPSQGMKLFDLAGAPFNLTKEVYGGLIGFLIAAGAGGAAIKGGLTKIHAIAGLVGFGIAAAMWKVWKIGDIMSTPFLGAKLLGVAMIGGLIVSGIAVAKPEKA